MRVFLKYLFLLIIPVSTVLLWLSGAFHIKIPSEKLKKERKIVKNLKTFKVKPTAETYTVFTGTVIPSERTEISTKVAGFIKEFLVKEGDFVKKGQLLVRLDLREIKAQIESVQRRILQAKKKYEAALARYKNAENTYKRYKKLLEEKAVTLQEYENIEANYKTALADVKSAEEEIKIARKLFEAVSASLAYAEIKSPFDGYVVEKKGNIGDMALPGKALIILEKPPYKVEFSLPESYTGKIKKGQKVSLYIEVFNKRIYADVVEIEPSVDPSSRTFKVKALIKDQKVKGGLFAKVFIPSSDKSLFIPAKAVFKKWDFTGVWVVKENNVLELRFVRLGKKSGNKVEVLSGISEGEVIVIEGIEKACEGCVFGG